MPTNGRKTRRHRDLLEAGRNATSLVNQYKAEKEASDRALVVALDRVADLENRLKIVTSQHDELTIDLDRLGAIAEQLRATCDRQAIEIRELKARREEQFNTLTRLQKENEELRAEDKDSAKLRRRLSTAKEELSDAHRQIRELKRQEAF